MENFEGESLDGLEAKEEKQAPVPPKLRFKLEMKIDQETDIKEGKKVDHSGSEVSSKALEGQMRVDHTEPQKSTMNGNDAIYGEKNFTCKICEKRFPSQQSLCGHMRCHPEKNRRGLNPPVNSSRPISTTSPDHHDDGHLLRLPAGGGPAVVRADQRSMKNDEDDEVESVKNAVYGLMFLATGDELYRNVPSKHDEDEIRAWVKKNHHLSAEEAGSPSSKTPSIPAKDDEDEGKTPYALEINAGQSQEQALMVARGGGTHECKICGIVFPCGRSLGGHKRKHRKVPPQDQAQAAGVVVEAEARGEEDQVARKQVFMSLDLNEIPPQDDFD